METEAPLPENASAYLRKYGHLERSPAVKFLLFGTGKSGLTPIAECNAQNSLVRFWYSQALEAEQQLSNQNAATNAAAEALGALPTNITDNTRASWGDFGGDLDCEIHPIFARHNWFKMDRRMPTTGMERNAKVPPATLASWKIGHGIDGYWEASNDVVWKEMLPILRLATKFLTNIQFSGWFDTLLFGEPSSYLHIDGNIASQALDKEEPGGADRNRERNLAALQKFAGKFAFHFGIGTLGPLGMSSGSDGSWFGINWLSPPNFGRVERTETLLPVGVDYTTGLLNILKGEVNKAETDMIRFHIALTLVHELCHSMWSSRRRDQQIWMLGKTQDQILASKVTPLDPRREPFYGMTEVLSELGHSMTQYVFGCNPVFVTEHYMVVEYDWPSIQQFMNDYRAAQVKLATVWPPREKHWNPAISRPPAVIPIEYFTMLSKKDFWDYHLPMYGQAAMFPPSFSIDNQHPNNFRTLNQKLRSNIRHRGEFQEEELMSNASARIGKLQMERFALSTERLHALDVLKTGELYRLLRTPIGLLSPRQMTQHDWDNYTTEEDKRMWSKLKLIAALRSRHDIPVRYRMPLSPNPINTAPDGRKQYGKVIKLAAEAGSIPQTWIEIMKRVMKPDGFDKVEDFILRNSYTLALETMHTEIPEHLLLSYINRIRDISDQFSREEFHEFLVYDPKMNGLFLCELVYQSVRDVNCFIVRASNPDLWKTNALWIREKEELEAKREAERRRIQEELELEAERRRTEGVDKKRRSDEYEQDIDYREPGTSPPKPKRQKAGPGPSGPVHTRPPHDTLDTLAAKLNEKWKKERAEHNGFFEKQHGTTIWDERDPRVVHDLLNYVGMYHTIDLSPIKTWFEWRDFLLTRCGEYWLRGPFGVIRRYWPNGSKNKPPEKPVEPAEKQQADGDGIPNSPSQKPAADEDGKPDDSTQKQSDEDGKPNDSTQKQSDLSKVMEGFGAMGMSKFKATMTVDSRAAGDLNRQILERIEAESRYLNDKKLFPEDIKRMAGSSRDWVRAMRGDSDSDYEDPDAEEIAKLRRQPQSGSRIDVDKMRREAEERLTNEKTAREQAMKDMEAERAARERKAASVAKRKAEKDKEAKAKAVSGKEVKEKALKDEEINKKKAEEGATRAAEELRRIAPERHARRQAEEMEDKERRGKEEKAKEKAEREAKTAAARRAVEAERREEQQRAAKAKADQEAKAKKVKAAKEADEQEKRDQARLNEVLAKRAAEHKAEQACLKAMREAEAQLKKDQAGKRATDSQAAKAAAAERIARKKAKEQEKKAREEDEANEREETARQQRACMEREENRQRAQEAADLRSLQARADGRATGAGSYARTFGRGNQGSSSGPTERGQPERTASTRERPTRNQSSTRPRPSRDEPVTAASSSQGRASQSRSPSRVQQGPPARPISDVTQFEDFMGHEGPAVPITGSASQRLPARPQRQQQEQDVPMPDYEDESNNGPLLDPWGRPRLGDFRESRQSPPDTPVTQFEDFMGHAGPAVPITGSASQRLPARPQRQQQEQDVPMPDYEDGNNHGPILDPWGRPRSGYVRESRQSPPDTPITQFEDFMQPAAPATPIARSSSQRPPARPHRQEREEQRHNPMPYPKDGNNNGPLLDPWGRPRLGDFQESRQSRLPSAQTRTGTTSSNTVRRSHSSAPAPGPSTRSRTGPKVEKSKKPEKKGGLFGKLASVLGPSSPADWKSKHEMKAGNIPKFVEYAAGVGGRLRRSASTRNSASPGGSGTMRDPSPPRRSATTRDSAPRRDGVGGRDTRQTLRDRREEDGRNATEMARRLREREDREAEAERLRRYEIATRNESRRSSRRGPIGESGGVEVRLFNPFSRESRNRAIYGDDYVSGEEEEGDSDLSLGF